ncbi:hypothetical protein Clacol_010430 [Clathrus columnatus]|uniref:Uncharacterized protein n=1 Tax=Clathrus columnatus TaxID=1419009 RepID=A0AAV5AW74_9AGAM|nr:hypothetical protein Clacol_010430 [Clathrus columnatus]
MASVLEFLERRPRLAKSVRSIKLSNSNRNKTRLPPGLSGLIETIPHYGPMNDTDIAVFKSAVSRMPLLKEFSWDCIGSGSPEQYINISHALTTPAPCLEGLYINIFDLKNILRDKQQMKRLSIWSLTSLKRVVLRFPSPSPDGIQMILSCPNIEDLSSEATSQLKTFPFYMLQQANWTKLRRLEFQKLSLTNGAERDTDVSSIVTSFFVRHSNIECLSFYVSPKIALSTLPPSSLPKLRSLSSHLDAMMSLLSKNVISRLVHLTCTVGEIDSNTLPQMDKLESLRLFGNANRPDLIRSFLSKAPNLKKISVALWVSDPWNWACDMVFGGASSVGFKNKNTRDQYMEFFLENPQSNLTHIHIISPPIIGSDRASIKYQIGTLCEKLSALRALKYVEVAPDHVELERDENGTYSGYRSVSLKKADQSSFWGGFFSDLSD